MKKKCCFYFSGAWESHEREINNLFSANEDVHSRRQQSILTQLPQQLHLEPTCWKWSQPRSIRVKIHHLLSLVHSLKIRSVLILPSSQTKIQTISRLLSKRGQNSQSLAARNTTTLLQDRLLSQQIFSPVGKEGEEICCTCAQKGMK